ncbi:MAG TPA: outer membrane lipoprotein chaperone LolA [Bryobacteraceae bacterium]|nr:outer membrane lipoprotein chaperone LolA [Bryobacteraceae bacterium]
MTRTSAIPIALCVCLCLGSVLAGAADDDSSRILKSIQDRYNHARTLQVSFTETYTAQGRPRQTESGLLTLRKPGRMRWDYSAPSGKLFVSDGKDVYLYTPDSKKVEKQPLKASEDMRAPLAFLLGKLDFQKEFRDFEIKPEGSAFVITAKAKTDKLPYDGIKLTAAPDFQIRNLEIRGADQSVLAFKFDNEKLNPMVNDVLFKFQMPAGATLVTAEASQ